MPFVMKAHGKLLSVRGSCEADDDGIAHSTDMLESCGYCTSCDTGTVTTGCVTTCGLYLIRTMDLYVTLQQQMVRLLQEVKLGKVSCRYHFQCHRSLANTAKAAQSFTHS